MPSNQFRALTRKVCSKFVKQMFAIIKGIDTSATITSASGMQIKSTKDFPKGKKFSDAFKPIQSINTKSVMKQMFAIIKDIDTSTTISSALLACRLSQQKKFSDAFKSIQSINTKSVKMVFRVSTSIPFQSIKCRHTHLFLDFLRAKNMFHPRNLEVHREEEMDELVGDLQVKFVEPVLESRDEVAAIDPTKVMEICWWWRLQSLTIANTRSSQQCSTRGIKA